MKTFTRAFVAVAVAAALSTPSVALAASGDRERGRDKSAIARIVQKIKKAVGIGTHEDLPTPPIPIPKP